MADQSRVETSHANAAPQMDYPEHERTYEGFVRLVEVGVPVCINVVLTVALWGMRSSNLWGVLGLLLTVVAAVLGASNGRLSWRPGIAVTLLLLAVLGLTGGGEH